MEKLPSQRIEEFLALFRECQEEYQKSISEVWKYDKKKQDQLHDLEFANNYEERCKIATRIHAERVARRQFKDQVEMTEALASFYADKQNKPFFDRLKGLLEKQQSREAYLLGERHYNRRGGETE